MMQYAMLRHVMLCLHIIHYLLCCILSLLSCSVSYREKVEAGLQAMTSQNQSILHTAPHHDDIMLSYHGAMHHMLGRKEDKSTSENSVHQSVVSEPNSPTGSPIGSISISSSGGGNGSGSGVTDKNTSQSAPASLPLSLDVSEDMLASSSSFGLLSPESTSTPSPSPSHIKPQHQQQKQSAPPQHMVLSRPLPGLSPLCFLCGDIHANLGEEHGNNVNHFAYLTSGFHSVSTVLFCSVLYYTV